MDGVDGQMIDLVLQRISSRLHATYGLLMENNEPWLCTIEDAWKDNEPFKSCIPPGSYLCQRVVSPKFGETFELINVPNRTKILFHWGDDEDDTAGCLLLGMQWGNYTGKTELDLSREAHKRFMRRLDGIHTFMLHVRREGG